MMKKYSPEPIRVASPRDGASSPLSVRQAAVLACLTLTAALQVVHAQEETIPLYLTMSQVVDHDDNLLRDNRFKSSDVISSTKAKLGLDKSYGRQHYVLDATLAKNKYKNNEKYDNDSHTVTGGFTTDIASDFRLNLNGRSARSLPAFENNVLNRQQRNIVRSKGYGADLRYGLAGRMSVNGGFGTSNVKYDLSDYDNRDASSAYVGLRYLPNDLMYFGLVYTKTGTDYPRRIVDYQPPSGPLARTVGEEVDNNNVSLNARWRVTGFSLFTGSIGYSNEEYKFDKRRDFKGVTGDAGWVFTPAGKVTYRLSWSRDTNNSGSQTYDYLQGDLLEGTLTGDAGYIAANRVTNTYAASASYEATSKLSFNLAYTYANYSEQSSSDSLLSGGVVSSSKKGRYNGYSIGGDYQPINSVGLGCSAQFYERTQSLFQVAYDGRSLSCYASFTLQ